MQRVALEEAREKLEVYLDRLKTDGPLLITRDGRPVAVLMALDEAGLAALQRQAGRPMADEERVEEDTWAGGAGDEGEGDEDEAGQTGSTDEESMQTSARPHPHHHPTTGMREETE